MCSTEQGRRDERVQSNKVEFFGGEEVLPKKRVIQSILDERKKTLGIPFDPEKVSYDPKHVLSLKGALSSCKPQPGSFLHFLQNLMHVSHYV